jgi:hypothetical protein
LLFCGRYDSERRGRLTAKSKRDSSTSRADSFAGAKEKKKRRPAPVLPAAGRRNDRFSFIRQHDHFNFLQSASPF